MDFLDWCVAAALAMSAAALFIGVARLVIGPTLADRVVAIDLLTMILVVVLTLFALLVEDGVYLDAAIPLALVSFLATVALARYIERADRADLPPPRPGFDRAPGPRPEPGAPDAAEESRP